jgi:hypothetical protein
MICKGADMRLVTIQDKSAYDDLCATGVLRCKAKHAEWLREDSFRAAYDWLAEQMKLRVGEPPQGVNYPIWAWHLLDGKPVKVDLRKTEFNNYRGEHYALTIDVPDAQVLLSDEENWHFVLNNWYLSAAKNEADYDAAEVWFDALPPDAQRNEKQKSWNRIFDVSPFDNGWHRQGCYVQATFWELRKEQVVSSRRFIGRQK